MEVCARTNEINTHGGRSRYRTATACVASGSGSGRGLVRRHEEAGDTVRAWELGRGIHALLILRSTLAASFNGRPCMQYAMHRSAPIDEWRAAM
jgi:hypothetical protein